MDTIRLNVTVYSLDVNAGQHSLDKKVNRLLRNCRVLNMDALCDATVDDLCIKCAMLCGIPPMYLNLFALKNSTGIWLNPAATLRSCLVKSTVELDAETSQLLRFKATPELEFRVRFVVPTSFTAVDGARRYSTAGTAARPVMRGKVLQYFFRQQREDFLLERLKLKDTSDLDCAILSMAVIDVLRISRELFQNLQDMTKRVDLMKLLPRSHQSHYSNLNWFMRWKVLRRFRHCQQSVISQYRFWQRSKAVKTSFLYNNYLKQLCEIVNAFGIETYLILGENSDYSAINVGFDIGIVKHNESSGASEKKVKVCDFQDIVDVRLQQVSKHENPSDAFTVSLTQYNGTSFSVTLQTKEEAENLVSCIDGYYRLAVDSHHYLCKSVCPTSLLQQLSLKCHCPISKEFAEDFLRSNHEAEKGYCLLRCSPDRYGEYFIIAMKQDQSELVVKQYSLDRVDKFLGMYGDKDSHHHHDLASLLDECRQFAPFLPFNVDWLIPPLPTQKSNLNVCSPGGQGEEEHRDRQVVSISHRNYTYVDSLGRGSCTEVLLYARKDKRGCRVAMKRIADWSQYINETGDHGFLAHIRKALQDSILNFDHLRCAHIVRPIGLMGEMLALEFVQQGSVIEFLRNSAHEELQDEWFIQVLWQLALACAYLEDSNCPHGNVRGKNVLLQHATPKPFIKLSDCGVPTSRYLHHGQFVTEPILAAPWLAYEFCKIKDLPLVVEPSCNGDKWSFATTCCEICSREDITRCEKAFNLSADMKQSYKHQCPVSIPGMLYSNAVSELRLLLLQCWSKTPWKRPSFKQIVRELGTLLSTTYHVFLQTSSEEFPQSAWPSPPDQDVYDDEHLLPKKKLGEGNFGFVHLCLYKANGREELVAVKSLKVENAQADKDMRKEILSMRKLRHPYIVKFLGVADPSMRIVMEYLPCGKLADYLKGKSPDVVPLCQLLDFSAQIAQGMLVLQGHRIIHRDLALRNILLHQDSPSGPLSIKISDFGMACVLQGHQSYYSSEEGQLPVLWFAPESLPVYGKKTRFFGESDIWSFGVTLWEMFSYVKFPNYQSLNCRQNDWVERLFDLLRDGQRLPQPEHCPEMLYDVIKQCWCYEPQDRIKFSELVCELNTFGT